MNRPVTRIACILIMALLMTPGVALARTEGKAVRIAEQTGHTVRYSIDSGIEAVKINAVGDIVFCQSDRCEVVIHDYVADTQPGSMCSVDGNTLSIHGPGGGELLADKIEIFAPEAGIFFLQGVAMLHLGSMANSQLVLRIYGIWEVTADNLDVDKLNLQVFGTASVRLGKTKAVSTDVMIAGMADITFKEIDGTTIDANMAGGGTLDLGSVTATRLKASLSGAGEIFVRGKVDVANIMVTGVGEVDTSGLKARKMVNYNSFSQYLKHIQINSML